MKLTNCKTSPTICQSQIAEALAAPPQAHGLQLVGLRPVASSLSSRRAFTLVELLVTVSVIAVLAGLLLGALYTAQDAARSQKTKTTIAKLHTMLMARYEAYKTRRVPITIPPGTNPNLAAAMRLTALRELMRLEMPDRSSDIPDLTVTSTTYNNVGVSGNTVTIPRPSVSYGFKRRWGTPAAGDAFHGAESLYIVLTSSTNDDESGRESFGDSEVGDIDNDGRPEFKDAWGNPISWVRWPAGFISELQPVDATTGNRDFVKNHDPFDPRRVDAQAYALVPLIFSPGPDGKYEINNEPAYIYVQDSTTGMLNPYGATSPPPLIGGPTDQDSDGTNDSVDNIHNHLIGTR